MKESKFSGILPLQESDKAKDIIVKDKKLFTIVMIVMLILTCITMLVSFIVGIVNGSAEMAIIAILSAALSVLQILVLITVAHNVSRQTAVLIALAEKIIGGNPLPNANGAISSTQGKTDADPANVKTNSK